MARQRNRKIHFQSGFCGTFEALWPERSWIDLSGKEAQNPFADSFGFKNLILDFLKETHPWDSSWLGMMYEDVLLHDMMNVGYFKMHLNETYRQKKADNEWGNFFSF